LFPSSDYKGYSESWGLGLPEILVFAYVYPVIVKNNVVLMLIAAPTSNLTIWPSVIKNIRYGSTILFKNQKLESLNKMTCVNSILYGGKEENHDNLQAG
jgi:hypothetical protein